MPGSKESDNSDGEFTPKMTRWERLRYAMVRPDNEERSDRSADEPQTVEELEATIATADDKERAIGLIAAPLGAVIGLLVSNNLIDHAKSLHQSTSEYETLTYVILGLCVVMLGTAWWRKRLFLGMAMALYGLAIFNLHYWGFGVPFLLFGAWYLVRAYRLQQKLKLATGQGPGSPRRARPSGTLPRPNKRYTPPTAPLKRPAKPKPENQ